jgi:hypothetical protein
VGVRGGDHEDIWESGSIVPPILTSALDGGEWLVSEPGNEPRYPLDRRLCRPTLEAEEHRNISCPVGNRTYPIQPVAIPSKLSLLQWMASYVNI